MERLNDIAITQLSTEGFDRLSEQQKRLSYHLAQAGLWGRYISQDQGSSYNVPLICAFVSLHKTLTQNAPALSLSPSSTALLKAATEIKDSLFTLFVHNGVYHSTTGKKITLPIEAGTLALLKEHANINTQELGAENAMLIQKHCSYIADTWFSDKIKEYRTVQKDGVDTVAASGINFYHNLTQQEVEHFRQHNRAYEYSPADKASPQRPPFGFNERLVKLEHENSNQGVESLPIERQVIFAEGLYGRYVKKIIQELEQSLKYTENEEQHASLSTLIDFYRSGDPYDYDKHCIAWVKDQKSSIYYINGLIESYDDPLGVACNFESIVAFKNPEQTAKVKIITDNIQWFEDNLPFDKQFKKSKAIGLDASSVSVISMAGETSPTPPLGINLPNSDWIRKEHGSKSVNLSNVAQARASQDTRLRHAFFFPAYHQALEKYEHLTNSLHTDLHEVAGHGSGMVLPGVNTDILGAFYSTIEEARADLVALYYIADDKLKELGVYGPQVDPKEAAFAQYTTYLTNGAFGQLRRIPLGQDLTQAHFRNRQLISLWVLEKADPKKLRLVQTSEGPRIELNDVEHVRHLFGQLLAHVQKIKSTGDFKAAKELVMTYGTQIDPSLHKQTLDAVEKLNLAQTVAFKTPEIVRRHNEIHIAQPKDFLEQQLSFHERYVEKLLKNMHCATQRLERGDKKVRPTV